MPLRGKNGRFIASALPTIPPKRPANSPPDDEERRSRTSSPHIMPPPPNNPKRPFEPRPRDHDSPSELFASSANKDTKGKATVSSANDDASTSTSTEPATGITEPRTDSIGCQTPYDMTSSAMHETIQSAVDKGIHSQAKWTTVEINGVRQLVRTQIEEVHARINQMDQSQSAGLNELNNKVDSLREHITHDVVERIMSQLPALLMAGINDALRGKNEAIPNPSEPAEPAPQPPQPPQPPVCPEQPIKSSEEPPPVATDPPPPDDSSSSSSSEPSEPSGRGRRSAARRHADERARDRRIRSRERREEHVIKPKEIGFFDPAFTDTRANEHTDIYTISEGVLFTDIYAWTDQLYAAASRYSPAAVRHMWHKCLRGKAYEWYTYDLDHETKLEWQSERTRLGHIIESLIESFKMSLSEALEELGTQHYTLHNVRAGEHITRFVRHVGVLAKHAGHSTEQSQLMYGWTKLDERTVRPYVPMPETYESRADYFIRLDREWVRLQGVAKYQDREPREQKQANHRPPFNNSYSKPRLSIEADTRGKSQTPYRTKYSPSPRDTPNVKREGPANPYMQNGLRPSANTADVAERATFEYIDESEASEEEG